jgi:hypothetical protein
VCEAGTDVHVLCCVRWCYMYICVCVCAPHTGVQPEELERHPSAAEAVEAYGLQDEQGAYRGPSAGGLQGAGRQQLQSVVVGDVEPAVALLLQPSAADTPLNPRCSPAPLLLVSLLWILLQLRAAAYFWLLFSVPGRCNSMRGTGARQPAVCGQRRRLQVGEPFRVQATSVRVSGAGCMPRPDHDTSGTTLYRSFLSTVSRLTNLNGNYDLDRPHGSHWTRAPQKAKPPSYIVPLHIAGNFGLLFVCARLLARLLCCNLALVRKSLERGSASDRKLNGDGGLYMRPLDLHTALSRPSWRHDVFRGCKQHAQARPAGEERRCLVFRVCCFRSGCVGAPGRQQHLLLHPFAWLCCRTLFLTVASLPTCCCLCPCRIWSKMWKSHTA